MWAKYRRQRHLSIGLAPDIKCQLVNRKALGEGSMGSQIERALKQMWGRQAPAVVPHPSDPSKPITSGRFAGMREQIINDWDRGPSKSW